MLALVAGSSVGTDPSPKEKLSDVEGVTFDRQKAFLKPSYRFERESVTSAAVVKTSNVARIQTGDYLESHIERCKCENCISGQDEEEGHHI
jgi:hypothetical protein